MVQRMKVLLCATALLAAGLLAQAHAQELEYAFPTYKSPEEQKALDEKRKEEERVRQEEQRRERQQIDDELSRRGWPKSREGEVRKFLQLQKQAAALRPKPGAGAALRSEPASSTPGSAQDYWEQKRAEVSKPVLTSPATSSPNEANCWTVDAPAKVAVGFSRVSEEDAREEAIAATKGCKIVTEMFCDSRAELLMNKNGTLVVEDGKMKRDGRSWDCRVSYHCGETQQQCENKPAAASKQ
jgi:hypothetical protein